MTFLFKANLMKKLFIVMYGLLIPLTVVSQTKPVKIVFDITAKDTLVHQTTLRHVSGMAKAYPDSKFEVVIYGGALPMVVKGQSTVAKSIQALENNKRFL